MKKIIFIITLVMFANASSYKYSSINMQIDFQLLSKNKKSKTLKYYYDFAIYYDESKKFTEKLFCFNDKKSIYVTKNTKKPKFKVCLDQNNKGSIYVMDKNYRYQIAKEFEVKLKNISLTVENKDAQNSCSDEAHGFKGLTNKINQCLKKI